ncbi:VOC family protein [Haloferula sp. BvORR071]|uniref:bleomycin resistance protein n=1 Tax=Haloferula sp. BvORR071 TaxID=1396141 RepID=UPI002241031F|nr:VOC family protein [Haloferula sp. BvORR071]
MLRSVVPTIAITDSGRAEDYYTRVLGFTRSFVHRPDPQRADPCYLGMVRDGVSIHLESFKPERAGLTGAFFWVEDVDQLYQEIAARGAVVQLPPTDQTWGTRELHVRDPDGNVLCFAMKQ